MAEVMAAEAVDDGVDYPLQVDYCGGKCEIYIALLFLSLEYLFYIVCGMPPEVRLITTYQRSFFSEIVILSFLVSTVNIVLIPASAMRGCKYTCQYTMPRLLTKVRE